LATEAQLIDKARRGDRRALESLLEAHLPMVYKFVSMKMGREHADLEDVVQETLIAAANSIGGLRAERDGSMPKWLLTIARHKVADQYRHSLSRPQPAPDGDLAAFPSGDQDVPEIVAQRDRDRRLREAMQELTPEQEEVLVLRFVLGFDGARVAAITGRTPGAVKSLQHRGLASLEKLLVRHAEDWR
jgi:RNA polymerase sigma-70 factor (ECF subfamily)